MKNLKKVIETNFINQDPIKSYINGDDCFFCIELQKKIHLIK